MAAISATSPSMDEQAYQRRIRAWAMYDWANSAFATTIMAAVLPVYYSTVAGATLPSAAKATAYWSAGLSISIFIVALLSPILGTISDIMRGKKRFLAIFFGIGIIATGLMVLIDTGDWLLASLLFIFGRIGFAGANVFYDSLLPHVAREQDLDSVSARGYALGYLGGGLLLAVNVVMLQYLPGTWGARISFLSVAIWWALFSIPLFRQVPEPPAATATLSEGETVLGVSFRRLWNTLKDIRQYKELFKYLIAFLIYIDGIGTIIGIAAIYGAELGLDDVSLILALLLVQFVGIPFSLIFGRLPTRQDSRRPFYLAFVLLNILFLPAVGIIGTRLLPATFSGAPAARFQNTATAFGEGSYTPSGSEMRLTGDWQTQSLAPKQTGLASNLEVAIATKPGSQLDFPFNGQKVRLIYTQGPNNGIWAILIDGQPYLSPDTGTPLLLDTYNPTVRYEASKTFTAAQPGAHTLTIQATDQKDPASQGYDIEIAKIEVLPGLRTTNLLGIVGSILGVELLVFLLSWWIGGRLFSGLAATIDTRRGILLALLVYTVIAIWGYFLNSVMEFWYVAWMVATVQGGSQALSRSLFSYMSPARKSGEFFGLFGIMEKFSAIIGPLIFAYTAATFGSSRPAILSIIIFFIIGSYLLTRVNVEAGHRVAVQEDARTIEGKAAS